jgi:hypothetical protein
VERRAITRSIAAAVLAAAACSFEPTGGDDSFGPGETSTTNAESSTGDASESGSSSSDTQAATESSSSGEALPGDPNYPQPTPVGELGMCPDGFLGPITFDGAGWGCIPACDPLGGCPAAVTGDAVGECASNPASSATPCMDSSECEVEGEMCGNAGNGQRACLLPPSHCLLWCDDGQTCPDAMTCSPAIGVCQYVP